MKPLCRYFLLIAAVMVFTAAQEVSIAQNELQKFDIQKWVQWVQDGGRWDVAPNGELLIVTMHDSQTEVLYFTIHTKLDDYEIFEGSRTEDKKFSEPSIHIEWTGANGSGHAYTAALMPREAVTVPTTLENLREKGGIFFAGTWKYCKNFGEPFVNSECAEVFKKHVPFLFPPDSGQ